MLDKGQEGDWFGATWIRWALVIIIVGLVAFLWREIRAKKPLVDMGVFRDRNFLVGCLQIFFFGAVVYGMLTILPLFFQTLLGYTALSAGLAVASRGVGAIIAMPFVGFLMSKVDSRYLIMAGFAGVAVCSLWLGHVTLDISQWSMSCDRTQRILFGVRFRAAGDRGHGHAGGREDRKRERRLQPVSKLGRQRGNLGCGDDHRPAPAVAPE